MSRIPKVRAAQYVQPSMATGRCYAQWVDVFFLSQFGVIDEMAGGGDAGHREGCCAGALGGGGTCSSYLTS